MEETLDHSEWVAWQTFYSLYDLPDSYFMAAKFGAYMVGVEPWKVTPIYEENRPTGSRGIPEFVAFATGYLRSPHYAQQQISQPQPRALGPPLRSLP
jgi:hypothetical protein